MRLRVQDVLVQTDNAFVGEDKPKILERLREPKRLHGVFALEGFGNPLIEVLRPATYLSDISDWRGPAGQRDLRNPSDSHVQTPPLSRQ